MTTNDFRKRLLGAGSALQVLALIGAGAAVAGIAAAPAAAQDYTSGSIAGTVTDESGSPVSGATVTIASNAQGFERSATTGSSGAFRFPGLPTGNYTLTVAADGKDGFTANDVTVLPSQSSDVSIGLTTTGNEIIVTGAAIVSDFAGNTTGINVDVAELVKTVPVSRDLTSVVLLAPGTSRGDSAFGNLASIGGASVAENAYYINGLNITNFDNYLGSAEVPFDFYRTVEVKSSGYPAEFGRATGGIINATTKSGSNEFTAAAHLYWSPNFLRSGGDDLLNCNYTAPQTPTNPTPPVNCTPSTNRTLDRAETRSLVLEAGGPIIKDRLFVYGLVEFQKDTSRVISRVGGTAFDRVNDTPFWGVKVDAYPVDGHHLELTVFDASDTVTRSDVAYSEPNGLPTLGLANSVTDFNTGGVNYVAKYTGNLTQWLTISGGYGVMKDRFDNIGVAGAAGLPSFRNLGGSTIYGVGNGSYYNGQRVASTEFPYETKREFYRGDVDLFLSLFGEHHIRGGFDLENNTLTHSTVRNGGDFEFSKGFISSAAYNAGSGGAGLQLIVRSPTQVELNYFNSGGSFTATNKSFYIQDEWDVTDRLTLNLGLRRDDFGVDRPDGANIVTLDENYAPRLGFTYELFEDHSAKFYGFYGDYFLPFASNTAFRTTGAEYFIRERFNFSGVDANGLPILGAQVTNNPSYQAACPFGLTPFSSGQNCNVTGDGSVKSADTLISQNLKATKVNEWMIGYEQNFSDVPLFGELKLGVNYVNRRLKANAEDVAIDAAVLAYCDEQNIAGCSSTWTGFHQYVILNPGQDAIVQLDGLDGRTVTLTAEDLNYDAAVRKYDAVELTFERPWDGKWNFGGSYTWSKSRGNSEGFVQSDFGQDDAGITQDFDQPGFMDGAYGRLPSDRRHRIKLYGAYSIVEGLTLGTNIRIDSPRYLSCLGHHPTDPFANAYGAASRYCNNVLVPRGTASKTDWITNFDLKLAYETNIPSGQTVRFRVDVFNVLNRQGVQETDEIGERESFYANPTAGGPDIYYANPNYGIPTTLQSPRSIRLGLDIEF